MRPPPHRIQFGEETGCGLGLSVMGGEAQGSLPGFEELPFGLMKTPRLHQASAIL